MRVKKAGLLTKLIILVMLVYAAISLLTLRSQIIAAEGEHAALLEQVSGQMQVNANLADDIQNSGDPAKMEEVARDRLGLVLPDERIFYDISG